MPIKRIDLQQIDVTSGGLIKVQIAEDNATSDTYVTSNDQARLLVEMKNGEVLKELLFELKKINKHLEVLTEVGFQDVEIEE